MSKKSTLNRPGFAGGDCARLTVLTSIRSIAPGVRSGCRDLSVGNGRADRDRRRGPRRIPASVDRSQRQCDRWLAAIRRHVPQHLGQPVGKLRNTRLVRVRDPLVAAMRRPRKTGSGGVGLSDQDELSLARSGGVGVDARKEGIGFRRRQGDVLDH